MAKVIKDKVTKRSLGYGFVKYSNEESAAEAIAKKGGMILGRKQLKVTYARPSCDEIKNCKLYVTNLPRDYSEREVMALFQQVIFYVFKIFERVCYIFCYLVWRYY